MEYQNFYLKWHYQSYTLINNLSRFLDSNVLTDVTLFAEGKSIKVHKLVLASCSTYFLHLFQNTPLNQQPIIVLHNIKYEDLKAIISYIYYGECFVIGTQVSRFLSVAEFLKIQGLNDLKFPDATKSENQSDQTHCIASNFYHKGNKESNTSASNFVQDNKSTSTIISPEWQPKEDEKDEEMYKFLTSYRSSNIDITKTGNSNDVLMEDVPDDKSDLKPNFITPAIPRKIGKDMIYRCDYCAKILSNQYNLKVHLETHQEGYHACHSCSHVSRSRDALRKHVSYRHPQNFTVKKKRKQDNN